ncbi:hypothetical protein DFAR_1540043 [Desulfarculales bacterium]
MVKAVHPGHPGGYVVAMMLEKIEVTPGEFVDVVSLAQFAILRAGVLGSPAGGNIQENFVGLFIGVHTLSHQPLERLQPQAKDIEARRRPSLSPVSIRSCGSLHPDAGATPIPLITTNRQHDLIG